MRVWTHPWVLKMNQEREEKKVPAVKLLCASSLSAVCVCVDKQNIRMFVQELGSGDGAKTAGGDKIHLKKISVRPTFVSSLKFLAAVRAEERRIMRAERTSAQTSSQRANVMFSTLA